MEPWQDMATAFFLVVGGFFGLVGSIGLMKLPSPMARLHAPTKATTLGVGGVLIASMLAALFERGTFSMHELLITLFLFLTAPITANFIAKVHLHLNVSPRELPPTGTGAPWAGEVEDVDPRGRRKSATEQPEWPDGQ
jgi:multicomponent K+:H+ antiporter subunit G